MTQKSRAQLEAQIDATIFDNATGAIDVAAHNTLLNDLLDSSIVTMDVPLNTPEPLLTAALSTTSIYLRWNAVVNATSYTVKRGTTTIYTGANLSFIDTGRTIDTSYDYTVVATGSGYADSEAASASQRTITFIAEWWFAAIGMAQNADNDYAQTDGSNNIIVAKGVAGSLNSATPNGNVLYSAGPLTPIYSQIFSGTSGVVEWPLGSTISNIGDFIYATRIVFPVGSITTTVVKSMFSAAADGSILYRIYSDRVRFNFGGSGVNAYHLASHNEISLGDRVYDFTVKRVGAIVSVSMVDEGEAINWNAASGFDEDIISIETLYNYASSSHWLALKASEMFVKGTLTDSQIREFFDWTYDGEYTNPTLNNDSALSLDNITWLDWPTNGYVSKKLHHSSGHALTKSKSINIADKTFLTHQLSVDDDFESFGVVIDHANSKYAEFSLPSMFTKTDAHEHPSFVLYDNRLIELNNSLYLGSNRLYVARSASNFDVSLMSEKKIYQGKVGHNVGNEQYLATGIKGNKFFLVQQEKSYYGCVIKYSGDYLNEFRHRYKFVESTTGYEWHYPVYIDNWYDATEFIFGIHCREGVGNVKTSFCLLRTTDGINFTSFDGVNTWDYLTDGTMTRAEINTNFSVKANAGGTDCFQMQQDENGEFYGIISDGLGGLDFFFGTKGGSLTFRSVTGHGITLVNYTDADASHYGGGVIKKSTNNYEVYALELNSGNHQVRKLTTSDKGTNWADGGRMTTETTEIHDNVYVTNNYSRKGKGGVHCTIYDTGNYAKQYWIKEI